MNKKIKDLTLQEIKELCKKHSPCFKNGVVCPLYKKTIACDQISNVIRSAERHNHDAMEQEIETQENNIALDVGKLLFKQMQPLCMAIEEVVEEKSKELKNQLYESYKKYINPSDEFDEAEFRMFCRIVLPMYFAEKGDENE